VVVEDDGLGVPVVDGRRAQPLLGGHFPRSSATLTARTFDEGTVSVTDLSEATAAPAGRALGLGPALTVRLAYGDRRFGVLVVARDQGRPVFSDEEREIVGRLAISASVALAFETLRAEVTEHERANTGLQARHEAHVRALEMNDVIVQTLCAAKWKLEAGNTEQASELLTEVIESAERIIAELLPPQVTVDMPAPPRAPGPVPGADNVMLARTPFDYTGWYLPAEER
jgi:GAF domain-containing protein